MSKITKLAAAETLKRVLAVQDNAVQAIAIIEKYDDQHKPTGDLEEILDKLSHDLREDVGAMNRAIAWLEAICEAS